MARRFVRTPEDFACAACGAAVRGDGYTNHCPACLWSRHVDVNPGDRAASCGAMMKPVAVEFRNDGFVLTHRCVECGHLRRNRGAAADDGDAVIALAAAAASEALSAGVLPDAADGARPGSARPGSGRSGSGAGNSPVRGTGRASGAPRRPDRRR